MKPREATSSTVKILSVAVGSIPDELAADFQRGVLHASDIPTRLQITKLDTGRTMFDELDALADGAPCAHASPQALDVQKAQVVGPVTLLQSGHATLQTCIRRIRAALDRLLDAHPQLNELWLDEPLLTQAPNDWAKLLGHSIRALKSEYTDLRIGVHCCATPRAIAFDTVDADSWAFDLHRDWEPVLALWKTQQPRAELVWSVVPTTGEAVAPSRITEVLDAHKALQPDRTLRISTSCGLGTRDVETVHAVLRHQRELVDALRERVR